MGIIHFAGLGRSPGAVTSGLCYLKMEKDRFKDEFKGEVVEKVVIFTTPEVARGVERVDEVVDNEYMERRERRPWREGLSPLEVVRDFLREEFGEREHFYVEVDANDFYKCFEAVAKALLKFHSPGDVGKHVWANITGGTNVLNAALAQVAHLSGFIPLLYYTFAARREDLKYLRPFSRRKEEFDFRWAWVPKTRFDERALYVYEELDRCGRVKDSDLLDRLKSRYVEFEGMDLQTFRRDFLNVMPGIGREGDHVNYLTEGGREMLKMLSSPLVKVLTRLESYPQGELEKLHGDLKLEEL